MTTGSNARAEGRGRPGPALEAVCQFAPWLAPTVNDPAAGSGAGGGVPIVPWLAPTVGRFPRSQRFLSGDRLQVTALDMLERLLEAMSARARRPHPAAANLGIEKPRVPCRLAKDPRRFDARC